MTEQWNASVLRELPTIHQGLCCDCKVDSSGVRVWLCRVGGGVTIEQYHINSGRWDRVAGDCYTTTYGEVHREQRQ